MKLYIMAPFLQLLLKNVENAEKGPNISKEDSILELEETSVDDGKYAVTQDEIGQRILTALKKVNLLFLCWVLLSPVVFVCLSKLSVYHL
jgi:hypothetical protein